MLGPRGDLVKKREQRLPRSVRSTCKNLLWKLNKWHYPQDALSTAPLFPKSTLPKMHFQRQDRNSLSPVPLFREIPREVPLSFVQLFASQIVTK